MRVAIAGAGAVGSSIASELITSGHEVMLIERDSKQFEPQTVEQAEWVLADACELASLEDAELQTCDVVIAATGDDKVNLVVSLLAKTEFAVNRVVARVNNPHNEWLFTEAWGVDVAVSTPRVLAAMVEEAVSIGGLVQLLTLRQGQANLVELTLPQDTELAGTPVSGLALPRDAALVTILRGGRVIVPQPDDPIEGGDELLFVVTGNVEGELRKAFGT
jgi:trk/ktr system potassium uptake protein